MKKAPGVQPGGKPALRAAHSMELRAALSRSTPLTALSLSKGKVERAAGLTLIEVALSVAILGGVIAALLVARSRAMQAHMIANEMMTCTRLCATQVGALRAGVIKEGEGNFKTPTGYRWSIKRLTLDETMPKGLIAFEVHIIPPAHDDEAGVTVVLWLSVPVPEGATQ